MVKHGKRGRQMAKKILIIDDDIKLVKLLRQYLEENHLVVDSINTGVTASRTIENGNFDLVILDIMLPEKDGLEVLKDIRAAHQIPVIMLTAKGEDTDRIVGLELGADDYLSKPFNPRELLARIKAIFRRQAADSGQQNKEELVIRSGNLLLNRAAHTVQIDDTIIDLSTTEFKMLEVLMKHPNTVLSRDQIMTMAHGRDFMVFDRTIDIHISKLRAKIETDPANPRKIKTIWGTGYMFVDMS